MPLVLQAALAAAHQAAEEVLRRGEARHAEALASASAVRDAVLGRLAATEAEFRQALQVRYVLHRWSTSQLLVLLDLDPHSFTPDELDRCY